MIDDTSYIPSNKIEHMFGRNILVNDEYKIRYFIEIKHNNTIIVCFDQFTEYYPKEEQDCVNDIMVDFMIQLRKIKGHAYSATNVFNHNRKKWVLTFIPVK